MSAKNADGPALHEKARSQESARETAVGRLMTICPHPTPEERRIYAEWIVDGLLDAVRVSPSVNPGGSDV